VDERHIDSVTSAARQRRLDRIEARDKRRQLSALPPRDLRAHATRRGIAARTASTCAPATTTTSGNPPSRRSVTREHRFHLTER
jgi:hypothetical protein